MVAGCIFKGRVRSLVTPEMLAVDLLLLHIERSELMWLGNLFKILAASPPERCSGHVPPTFKSTAHLFGHGYIHNTAVAPRFQRVI